MRTHPSFLIPILLHLLSLQLALSKCIQVPFFNHGRYRLLALEANTDYSLVYYPEPQTTWPWPVTVIANGTSNKGGNIHLTGSYDFGADLTDAKIWLVLSNDIVGGSLSGWNPSEYLFEYDLISYDDTDI